MPAHDFDGPVTNDKTAIFFKTTGVTASSNLVASLAELRLVDEVAETVKPASTRVDAQNQLALLRLGSTEC